MNLFIIFPKHKAFKMCMNSTILPINLTKSLNTAGSLSTGNNGKTEVFQTVKHLKKLQKGLMFQPSTL